MIDATDSIRGPSTSANLSCGLAYATSLSSRSAANHANGTNRGPMLPRVIGEISGRSYSLATYPWQLDG